MGMLATWELSCVRFYKLINNSFSLLISVNTFYAIVSSTAKATFCALESLTLTLLNDSDRTGRHTARSLASLCNPFRDQILELVKTGMR